MPNSASGTTGDKQSKSFVDSPSRGENFAAREVYVGNTPTIAITGGDGAHKADVIFEDDVRKLLVKSTTVPSTLGNLLFTRASLDGAGATFNMNVDGSTTPKEFIINAEPVNDVIVRELIFKCLALNIKINTFLSQNQALTNGLLINVTSNGVTSSFNAIKDTADFDTNFSLGDGGKFSIIFASGSDFLSCKFSPRLPFKLIGGTGDNIKVTVRDDLTNIQSINFQMFASEDL